jgi:hypothetical protein
MWYWHSHLSVQTYFFNTYSWVDVNSSSKMILIWNLCLVFAKGQRISPLISHKTKSMLMAFIIIALNIWDFVSLHVLFIFIGKISFPYVYVFQPDWSALSDIICQKIMAYFRPIRNAFLTFLNLNCTVGVLGSRIFKKFEIMKCEKVTTWG